MTKDEIAKIEGWTKYEVHEDPETPDIMLRDSRFSNESTLRQQLANYLRRIAQHLDA
jgi:hypothetical protein